VSKTVVRVVKVGGSLLDLPDLPKRMRCWLEAQTEAHQVLIVGGGRLVEQVRQGHAGDEVAAHWLCVDLMRLTAEFLHDRLPEVPLVEDFSELQSRLALPGSTLFSVANWLRHQELQQIGTRLPQSWEVTSDAIAARLAVVAGADELVLLKSALPDFVPPDDIAGLSATGFVDPMCARLASELPPCRVVNLRTKAS